MTMIHGALRFRLSASLCFLLFSVGATAQSATPDERLSALIDSYRSGERFAENARALRELVTTFRRRRDWPSLTRAQTYLGECLYELPGREAASLRAFHAAQQTVRDHGLDSTALPSYHRILQGLAAHYGRNSAEGQAYYRQLIDFVDLYRPNDLLAVADGLAAQASLAFAEQRYAQGAEFLRLAVEVGRGRYTDWELSLLYHNLAASYAAVYDYGRAQSAQRLATATTRDPYYRVQSMLNDASLYVDLRELTTARQLLADARREMENKLPPDSDLWFLYFNGRGYLENTADDLDAFAAVLREWTAFLERYPLAVAPDRRARYLNYLASLTLRQKKYALTDAALRQAEALAETADIAYDLTDSRRLLRAKLADATGDFPTSERLLHQLLSEWRTMPGPENATPREDIPASAIWPDLVSLNLVKDRAAHYARRNLRSPDGGFWDLAVRQIAVGDSLLLALRRQYDRPGVRRQLDEVALALRRIEIGLAELRFRDSRDVVYVEMALRASERIKYLDLSEELLNDRIARQDPRVRALIDRRQHINGRLDSLVGVLRKETTGTDELRHLRQQIERLGAERDRLRPQLLVALDSARQTTQATPLTVAVARRRLLAPGEALLHLVEQDSLTYLIYVDEERAELLRSYSSVPLDVRIDRLLADIETESTRAYEELRQLHQLLIAPILPLLGDRDLVVVPDGALAYLPFAALIGPGEGRPYLLYDRAVRLLLSGQSRLLQDDRPGGPPTLSALALAPFSAAGNNDWAALRWSKQTVEGLRRRLGDHGCRGFLAGEATRDRFRDLAGRANLLHIGTHARLDDEQPQRSALLFAPIGRPEEGSLYAGEIGSMEMGADLTVLAACETMGGRLYRGRGVANLAYAFTRAGCPNLLVNLWEIRDQTAFRLLSNFYDELYDEGLPKHRALRRAQLRYLEKSNDLTDHPAYWATLVYVGDPEPLRATAVGWSERWWWLVGLPLIAAGFWWGYSSLRRRAA